MHPDHAAEKAAESTTTDRERARDALREVIARADRLASGDAPAQRSMRLVAHPAVRRN